MENYDYISYVEGQKAWNGVAILSKNKLKILNNKIPTFNEDEQSRLLETEIQIKEKDIRIGNLVLSNEKISFTVEEKWTDLLQLVLITVIGAYFGGRSLEKRNKK